jgi:hypothetical protein
MSGARPDVITVMSVHNGPGHGAPPVHLVLVEQSGAKREIPQPSTVEAMIEAQQTIHRLGHHLREVKVISRHTAVARWRGGEARWRRVA